MYVHSYFLSKYVLKRLIRRGENNLKNYNKLLNAREEEKLKELEKGCGKKVDENGDCWYISSQGNTRYCSSCKRKIDLIKKRCGDE